MKVLVSDFDGTLFTKDYQKNIRAVNKFVKKGNIFIIATGRNVNLLKKHLQKNIKYSYLICNDGGIIVDSEGKILNVSNIENIDETLINIKKITSKDLLIDDGFNYSSTKATNNNAIMFSHNGEEVDLEPFNQIKTIKAYRTPTKIRMISSNNDKKNACLFLMNKLNLNKEDIITVGDQVNDIEMIEYFDGYIINDEKSPLLELSNKKTPSVYKLIREII